MSGEDEIAAQVAKATEAAETKKDGAGRNGKAQRKRKRPFPFKVEAGQTWREVESEGQDGTTRRQWVAFGSELNVLALSRSADGDDWGRQLEVLDRDGKRHVWAMPQSLHAGSGEGIIAELMRRGWEPATGLGRKWRDHLRDYLMASEPERRVRCVPRVGWHGETYVFPDEAIGASPSAEPVILQTTERLDHALNVSGSVDEWRSEVAAKALGNSRLILAISAAFAAPLLALTGDDGGGFHFRGASSSGKSTALAVAGSVWGGGGTAGYIRGWRATDNGMEGISAMHNDGCLCLDELGQVEPKAAGAAAYMLANGQGKARAGREGQARKSHEWRLIFLSSGELGLADKISEGGGRIAAGMEVRVIDLRADAGSGFGLFEELHGAAEAASFAQSLKAAAGRFYGAPARAFLRQVVADLPGTRDGIAALRRGFLATAVPPGADGQVRRVADRFALVAAAGDLASALGITGWPVGAAREACLRLFKDWLAERGGAGSGEEADARRRLTEAIETYGQARFQKWHANSDRAVITPRWGFVKTHAEGEEVLDSFQYFLTGPALKEILKGLDFRAMVAALLGKGIVPQGAKAEASKVFHVPNAGGKHRLYQIDLAALTGDGGQGDE